LHGSICLGSKNQLVEYVLLNPIFASRLLGFVLNNNGVLFQGSKIVVFWFICIMVLKNRSLYGVASHQAGITNPTSEKGLLQDKHEKNSISCFWKSSGL